MINVHWLLVVSNSDCDLDNMINIEFKNSAEQRRFSKSFPSSVFESNYSLNSIQNYNFTFGIIPIVIQLKFLIVFCS
jgi:hypothetical protein